MLLPAGWEVKTSGLQAAVHRSVSGGPQTDWKAGETPKRLNERSATGISGQYVLLVWDQTDSAKQTQPLTHLSAASYCSF